MKNWRDTDKGGMCRHSARCRKSRIVCRDCGRRVCKHLIRGGDPVRLEGTCIRCQAIPFYARKGRGDS